MKRLVFTALAIVLGALAALSPVSAEELTKDNYARIRDQILPNAEEAKWREIPWRVTYWDAVIEAQKADKPVMLFAMNGHPNGCT